MMAEIQGIEAQKAARVEYIQKFGVPAPGWGGAKGATGLGQTRFGHKTYDLLNLEIRDDMSENEKNIKTLRKEWIQKLGAAPFDDKAPPILSRKQETQWQKYLEEQYGYGTEEEEYFDIYDAGSQFTRPDYFSDLDDVDEYIAEKQAVEYPVDGRGFTYEPGMSP